MFHSAPTEKRVKVLLEQKGNRYRCKLNGSIQVSEPIVDTTIVCRRDSGRTRYMPVGITQDREGKLT